MTDKKTFDGLGLSENAMSAINKKGFETFKERLVTPLVINGTVITREDFQFEPDITVIGSLEMEDKKF